MTDPHDEESIFHAAREISGHDARVAFIEKECGGNAELVKRVSALLDANERDGSLLGDDAVPATTQSRFASVSPGSQIGRYKLLQKIGEGGFGTVYMAEQVSPVRRQVAVKVIKPGMDTKEVLARFEAERQALAMMDHPSIAKVLDGGESETGHPYFVMELVRGEPLIDFCDKNRLDARQRLKLFATVCNAIQHAHQKGIIHRDIKSSNVLVTLHDGLPVPKVIDFGVAKAISQRLTPKTLFTAYGQMVGTPQYMSPEQAEMSGLDIDTRSDIYSLGVLLYELLTGSTPLLPSRLRHTGYAEVRRLICEDEPPKPSRRLSSLGGNSEEVFANRKEDSKSLIARVRGELDWIVMKALEKDRERRYETAKGFALDVQRYLNDEPVSAGPPSASYRIRKSLKRHRRAVLAASSFIFMLCLAVFFTALAWYQERRHAKQKDEALARAVENEEAIRLERKRVQGLADSLARTLYAADMNNAMTAWEKNDFRQLKTLIDKYQSYPGRGWEWRFLNNLYETAKPKEYLADGDNILRVADVPGSRELITTHSRGWVFNLIDPEVDHQDAFEDLKDGTFAFTFVAIDPTGSRLAHPDSNFMKLVVRELPSMAILDEVDFSDGYGESEYRVSAASYSPDGQTLAIAFPKSGIAFLDLASMQLGPLIPLNGIGKCESLEFTSDGRFLAISSDPVTILDVVSHETVGVLDGHTQEVTSMKFVEDDKWLVTGARDRNAIVWDYQNELPVRSLGPFDGEVRCIAYSRRTSHLAVGLRNRKLKSWVLPTFGDLPELRAYNGLYAVDFDDEGRMIYGAFGGGVAVNRRSDLGLQRRLVVDGYGVDVQFSGDGRHLICLSNPSEESNPEWGKLELSSYSVDPTKTTPLEFPPIEFRVSCFATAIANGRSLVVVGGADKSEAAIIRFTNGEPETPYRLRAVDSESITTACFGADGKTVYLGVDDGRVLRWRYSGEHSGASFLPSGHRARVTSVAALRDGCVSGAGDGTIRVWDGAGELVSEEEVATARGTWIRGLSSHDGAFAFGLFGVSKNGERVFHVDKQGRRRGVYGHTFSMIDVALIEDGKTLLTLGGDREIKVWRTDTLEQTLAIREAEIFNALAVSPDESIIAASTREGSVFLYHAPLGD